MDTVVIIILREIMNFVDKIIKYIFIFYIILFININDYLLRKFYYSVNLIM